MWNKNCSNSFPIFSCLSFGTVKETSIRSNAIFSGFYPYDDIRDGIYELATSIAKRCVGIGLNVLSVDYNVDLAIRNIEGFEFQSNKSIIFRYNPFYAGEPFMSIKNLRRKELFPKPIIF